MEWHGYFDWHQSVVHTLKKNLVIGQGFLSFLSFLSFHGHLFTQEKVTLWRRPTQTGINGRHGISNAWHQGKVRKPLGGDMSRQPGCESCSSLEGWLGGGFKHFLFFAPIWGRFPIWLSHIFQMGWNHQLVKYFEPFGQKDIIPWYNLGCLASTYGLFHPLYK